MAITEVTSSQVRAPQDTSIQKDHTDCDHSSDGYAVQQSKRSKKKGRHAAKQTKSAKLRSRSQSRGENEEKVNFPTSLVEAHHAAYAYLNPSLSKYDAILSLTDQATQTQLMLQQMVSFLTLRFEEINQMLEEIAAEGERLVRDIGPHLTWPAEKGDSKEQPDLLQQLLLYTVNKMQATNGTVTSLTATVLQETCDYLQSAANIFQKRFLVKQQVDERLQILIDQLGSCTMQPAHTKPRDATLYSEDSGIGGDTDSTKECCTLKEYSNPEKDINAASCDSNAYSLCRKSHPNPPLSNLARTSCCCSNSHHHQCRGAPCSPPEAKASCSRPSGSASSASLRQNRSLGSFTSVECEALAHSESMDFCSLGEDDDEEEGSESDSTAAGSPRRPRSSPPGTTGGRTALKRIEKPENEEMTIKMKDAISHRIQFVPTPTASQAWSDDESKEQPARPRSAGGHRSRGPKKRRSRSAESLRSKAEDPTLLELQRTQKDLSRRLDRMHRAGAGAEAGRRKGAGSPAAAEPQAAGSPARAQPSATNTKLRASLRRNFSVLPSPERPPGQAKAGGSVQLLIGSFNRVGAEPPAPRRPSAPTLPSVPHLPHRKQRANSSPVSAAAALPTVTASTGTDTDDFPPPPPTTLELAADAAAPSYACAATDTDAYLVAGDGGACAAPGTGSPSTTGACAAPGTGSPSATGACAAGEAAGGPASVSKATVTQRLMASLDSVALLPSRHTGSGAGPAGARRLQGAAEPASGPRWHCGGAGRSQEHTPGAEPQRRSRPAGPLQDWQPYKIINLRYAGDSGRPAESGSALPQPDAARPPGPRKVAAAGPLSDRRGEEPSGPAPGGEVAGEDRAAFPPGALTAPSPPLKRACQQSEYSTQPSLNPTPPNVNSTQLSLNSKQSHPSPPRVSKQQTPPASPTRSHPVMARKLPSPPTHRKLPSPPTQQKQPSPFLHRKLPTPPASSRQPSSASSAKIGSNALSIFCPLSNSIFEAKPPSLLILIPVNYFSSHNSLDGNSENEGGPWMGYYVSDLRSPSRSVSHPELCIVGQRLQ
ncbi:photoreceptor cilium actin regulator-like [Pristis pectinata]|uniref:photoreceptor cilium actin regulator-like n=1 Tax=Pristis pectinata TaxID=685728 RepID=UPI00223DD06A|nr:photoreceptor cilium actin regulator-like [Pristis pectinata]